MTVPRRENNRPRPVPKRNLAEEIKADIARRAALPPDHPDYAVDDNDKTGPMGIRDNRELRLNASSLAGPQRKKKKKNG